MAEERPKVNTHELIRALQRHRGWLIPCLLGFMALALVGAHFVPIEYMGLTVFERRKDPAAEQSGRGIESFEAIKLTLEHELAGYAGVARAVEELGLLKGSPRDADGHLTREGEKEKQRLTRNTMKRIRVEFEVKSDQVDLVRVYYTSPDPRLAEQVPNVLVSNYINEVSNQIVKRLSASCDFLEERVEECNSRLADLVNERISFEVEHAGVLPDNPGILQTRINNLLADMDTAQLHRTLAEQRLERLQVALQTNGGLSGDPNNLVQREMNPEYVRLEQQLKENRDALDKALGIDRMKSTHPKVVALEQAIREHEIRLQETARYIYGPAVERRPSDAAETIARTQLTIELAATKSQVEMYAHEFDRLERRLTQLERLQVNFAPIRREYLELEKNIQDEESQLDRWEQRYTEVQMALAGELAKRRTHLDTVQAAQQQFLPSSPSLIGVIGASMALAAALSVGVIFLRHIVDRRVLTVEDAARLFEAPILGTIGEISGRGHQLRRLVQRWVIWPIMVLVLLVTVMVGTMSVALRLQFPDLYKEWKASPWTFVERQAEDLGDRL